MKESDEFIDLLSSIDKSQDLRDLNAQIEKIDNFILKNRITIKKRQLVINQEDMFLSDVILDFLIKK